MPGEVAELYIGNQDQKSHENVKKWQFWKLTDAVSSGTQERKGGFETIDRVHHLLQEKVEDQLISDAPVGAFLSGGTDSSLITALMQQASTQKISTYTIGFQDPQYNEAPVAKKIAKILGTDHHEAYLNTQQAMDIAISIADYYDEPFADSSQIPTFLLARFASQDLRVALSGDGGDEVFGGYNRYIHGPLVWKKLSHLPYYFRKKFGALLFAMSDTQLNSVQNTLEFLYPKMRGANAA
jgi:asparagine synthase (glutamine-hydrolysing)